MSTRVTAIAAALTLTFAISAFAREDDEIQRAIAAARVQAAAGDVVAQFSLASILYYGGSDIDQAIEWFRKAAAQGYPPAEFQMGQLYEFGFGVRQDDRVALDWYRKAAAHGSAAAHRAIGDFHRKGRAVAADAAEAARWYREAAARDDVRGQYQLADMYFNGVGVSRDYASAYLWFSLAAGQAPLADNRDGLMELRNIAAARMTPQAVADAAVRIRDWKPAAQTETTVKRDVMFVPTPQPVVDAMLEGAHIKAGDVVYDLGSGDGRIVITAARKYAARGVGIEIDPVLVATAKENAAAAGVSDRVQFITQNLFAADISDATVVTLYLLQSINERLRPKLVRELKPGTRVVSHVFNMGPEWPPEKTLVVDGSRIFFWTIAAR